MRSWHGSAVSSILYHEGGLNMPSSLEHRDGWQNQQKWLQQEYNARVREISMRIEQRQQLVNYSLVAIGGLAAFLGYGWNMIDALGHWAATLALVASGFFLLLALSYLKHDLQVAFNAEYIEKGIRPRLIEDGHLPGTVLGWEQFMNAKRRFPRASWWLHALLESVNLLLLLLPFALLSSYSGHYLFTHYKDKDLVLSGVHSYAVWFWGTFGLAVVVLTGLLLTLIAAWTLVRAQRAISKGVWRVPPCDTHQSRLDDLNCRVDGLERWRETLGGISQTTPLQRDEPGR